MNRLLSASACAAWVSLIGVGTVFADNAKGGPVVDAATLKPLYEATVIVNVSYMTKSSGPWVNLPAATDLTDKQGHFSVPVGAVPKTAIAIKGTLSANLTNKDGQWASINYPMPSLPIQGPYIFGTISCKKAVVTVLPPVVPASPAPIKVTTVTVPIPTVPPPAASSQFIGGPVVDATNGQILVGAKVTISNVYYFIGGTSMSLPTVSGLTGMDGKFAIMIAGIPSNALSVGGRADATAASGATTWQSGDVFYNTLNANAPVSGPYNIGPIPCNRTDGTVQHLALTYNVIEHFSPPTPPNLQNPILPGATMNVTYTCDGVVKYTQQGLSAANGTYLVAFNDTCLPNTSRTLNVTASYAGTANGLTPCNSHQGVSQTAPVSNWFTGQPVPTTAFSSGLYVSCFPL